MSGNNSVSDGGQDKSATETTVQTVPQNLTTIQSIQTVQSVQNVVPSNIQSIQTAQAVTGQTATLVGKSISLELSPKLLMKQPIGANVAGSSDSKIAPTFCAVPGSTVRIITPSMISSIERQPQVQQTSQQSNVPSTYHVPRGPAAVANISTPRATVATPLRAISQPIPVSRPGNPTIVVEPRGPAPVTKASSTTEKVTFKRVSVIDYCKSPVTTNPRVPLKFDKMRRASEASCNLIDLSVSRSTSMPSISTTVSSTQWPPKTTSVVYAQPQRQQSVPVVRPPVRPVTATVYTSQPQQTQQQQTQPQQQQQQQPRLVTPSQISVQGRPIQATVVTATPRLVTPVQLQAPNSTITRLPAPTRPPTPQVVTSLPQVSQAARPVQQTIQTSQTGRPISTPISRIAVPAPVMGASNRVATVTSVQTNVNRQLTINTAAATSTGTVSRIVIPQQAIQQQQQQQQTTPRVVQTVTPVNFSQVSRVIATTSSAAGVARVAQTGSTPVARIASMSLHPLPLTPARTTPQGTPLKVTTQTPTGTTIQAVQLKQTSATIQSQQQQSQPQQQQQQSQQQQQVQTSSTIPRQITGLNSVSVASTSAASQQSAQVQGQYLHSQHTTYYSIEPSGAYSQYRQTSVQPVRLLVEQGYEEPLAKPNASPRPSILRKREHDGSPGKSVAKNLVPVLASLPGTSLHVSPPSSPKGDRDNGGNHSSGSTTVSATSSPGLDEEPEQSRITINPTVEMSPRKKPRKQQLTAVEITESLCKEDMMFITEEKIRKDLLNVKEDSKDKYVDRKHGSTSQQEAKSQQTNQKNRPTLLEPGYKNQYNGRMHHFKRPSDVKAKIENKPTIYEIAQEKDIMKRIEGWKVHHLTAQMEDLAETEKWVYEKLRGTLTLLENQQNRDGQNDHLEKVNELIKGNMQRSNLISDGMNEARTQLMSMFDHKPNVSNLLQKCMNKRAQKKKEK
ncbi:histone deacetylase complex subunit SAP130-like isoform X2 [Phymastichus coffea]|uniref:histone deacetylase complex subunit SAP130-like isoform X2 n=1 Tax=Phymastichus coffea TaxID=108790 RepID=UPI00273AC996|nr:histone deacetylase complex subunit SAP130-like isoform X2 [Phymastichus coffea]